MRLTPLALVLLPAAAAAAPGAGTVADPIRIDALPYAWKATTVGAAKTFSSYAPCAPGTDESGPEVVFELELGEETRITAWLEGDAGAVDVDLQILEDLSESGGAAGACVARGNAIAEAVLAPGTHYLVVDTFGGDAQAGPFVLRVSGVGETWAETTLADGVVWRSRRWVDPQLGAQLHHALLVDTAQAGVHVDAVAASGCQTVAEMGAALGAVAGTNGGYFDPATCAPVSLLKHQGMLVASNAVGRGALGLGPDQTPLVSLVAAGADWPEASEAHGGGPVLVAAGLPKSGNSAWAAEGITDPAFIGANPRTLGGVRGDGRLLLGTVDGRRATAEGLTLDQLAAWAQAELDCDAAVNLDGGGSTTFWVAGAPNAGVANYPSDGPADEDPGHPGARGVSGGFFVFAPAYDHPPRIQTQPVTDAQAGEPYVYDVDAIDLDVDDVLAYALPLGPPGMEIDAVTGVITWSPTASSPSSVEVVVSVGDDQGKKTQQSWVLVTAGATGDPIGGGGEGGNGGGGNMQPNGCSCSVPSERPGTGVLLALVALALRRRR